MNADEACQLFDQNEFMVEELEEEVCGLGLRGYALSLEAASGDGGGGIGADPHCLPYLFHQLVQIVLHGLPFGHQVDVQLPVGPITPI